jgi:hypothetical protein
LHFLGEQTTAHSAVSRARVGNGMIRNQNGLGSVEVM